MGFLVTYTIISVIVAIISIAVYLVFFEDTFIIEEKILILLLIILCSWVWVVTIPIVAVIGLGYLLAYYINRMMGE